MMPILNKTEKFVLYSLMFLFLGFWIAMICWLAVDTIHDYNSDNAKTLNSLQWQVDKNINFIRIENVPEQNNQKYVTIAFQRQGQLQIISTYAKISITKDNQPYMKYKYLPKDSKYLKKGYYDIQIFVPENYQFR
ncbi:MAG: hypothetical protein PWR08_1639 [Thermoanaerobacterium sp.]|nr:hypothetical protein [Thermoanaerobacterium sp.]